MSNVPQSRHTVQADEATVAHSASHTKAPLEGELVVPNARSKARSKATPKEQYSQEYLLSQIESHWKTQKVLANRIAELEKDVAERKRALECHVAYRLEQGARIVELERDLAESRRGSAKLSKSANNDELTPANNQDAQAGGQYSQEYLTMVKRVEAAERQLDQMSRWKDQARTERDQAIADRDQAAIIVEDLTTRYRELGNEHTNLRAQFANTLEFIESKGWVYVEEETNADEAANTAISSGNQSCRPASDGPCGGEAALSTNGGLYQFDGLTRSAGTPRLVGNPSGSETYRNAEAVLSRYQGISSSTGTTELVTALGDLLTYCNQRNQYIQWQNTYIMDLQGKAQWNEQISANPFFEAASKEVARYVSKVTEGKSDTFTPIYREDVAEATGMSPQAAGRHLNLLAASGLFSAYRTEEKAVVPDARLGQRTIVKKVLNLAPTALLERPKEWKRGDGKEHGGARRRCKKCGAEDTLVVIPHTICLHCLEEDIWYPKQAQDALDRKRELQAEDAPAAVAEADWIVSQRPAPTSQDGPDALEAQIEATLPVSGPDADALDAQSSEIQDEQESSQPEKSDVMSLARAAGFPAVTLKDHGVTISAGSPAWSRWTHMSRPTDAQISATIEHFKGKPAPFDSVCDYCGSAETVWDPSGDGRRITACFVYPERRKPQAWEVQPAPASKTVVGKTVDFTSGKIVEVQG